MAKFKNKYRIESNRMPRWDYSGKGVYFMTLITQNRVCNLGNIQNGKMILSDFGTIVNKEWLASFEIRKELYCDDYIIMPNHLHAIVVLNKDGENDLMETDTPGTEQPHGKQPHGKQPRGKQPRRKQSHGKQSHGKQSHGKQSRGKQPHGKQSHGKQSHVETHGRASLQSQLQSQLQSRPKSQSNHATPSVSHSNPGNPFMRKPRSISSFIAGFKSAANSKIDDYIDDHQLDIPKYNRNNHFFQPNYHDHIIRNGEEYKRIKEYIMNNPKNWTADSLHKGK